MLQFVEALHGLYVNEDTEGQGLVEYALILAFISIALFLGVTFFGARLSIIYSRLANSIPSS